MEKAKVYYSDLRTSPNSNLLDKMERLLKRAGIEKLPLKDNFAAIKSTSGNRGIWPISVLIMRHAWQISCARSEPSRF